MRDADLRTRLYGVGEVASLSGVSLRTLHHYHAVGLLLPAVIGENGYRRYGRQELLRLQQILLHRELGMQLADIAAVLDAPSFDRLKALRRQRQRIGEQVERHRRLLVTIDRTIEELKGTQLLKDTQLYEGFEPEKQAEYEVALVDAFGAEAKRHIDSGRRRFGRMSPTQLREHMDQVTSIEAQLADAVRSGVSPDDPQLDTIMMRHHAWVTTAWASPPDAEAYTGLGMLYATHPDFVARYEARIRGMAIWLQQATAAFAQRHLP